ncbi:MAG: type II secretion system minor pseudopilin GspK [Desulfobulbus sp.]|nr:type II secretion system minor pseudopilin GspK [Desulfobulbus sp.]
MTSRALFRDQSGMALVMTLLIISFLVAMTLQLMMTADRQISVAASQRNQVRLDAMVLGGMNLVLAALQADQVENNYDSTQDLWSTFDAEKLQGITDDIRLNIKVDDYSGRLQVNALAKDTDGAYREIWLRLMLSGRFAIKDQDQAEALLDALTDWLDQDDEERPQGAENGYYQGLEEPYSCRNGKMENVEELFLVKGMTPAIVLGDQGHEGLLPYVTVSGEDGTINLNTAPLPVLQALHSDMTADLAQELIGYREDEKNREGLSQSDWYRRVPGFPMAIDFGSERLRVQSTYFQAKIEAQLHQYHRTGLADIQRTPQGQSIVRWQVQ